MIKISDIWTEEEWLSMFHNQRKENENNMKDYLFIDNESGEEFFVECRTLAEAWITVWENFGDDTDVEYIDEYTVEEAEILGYDTY